MTVQVQVPLKGFRYVEIQFGDSLQSIAARELGDAALWTQLITYNDLVPPFVTGDPTLAGPGVLLYGSTIRLPASIATVSAVDDPNAVFGIDVTLDVNGSIGLANGDFAGVGGIANLKQALVNRLNTSAGELIFHTDYGSRVPSLIGAANGPIAEILAEDYVKAAVLADNRISQVTQASASVLGDAITVQVEVKPVVGRVVTLQVTN